MHFYTHLLCYYFGWELCCHNYCSCKNHRGGGIWPSPPPSPKGLGLNQIIMMLECYKNCLQFKMKKHCIKTWKISQKPLNMWWRPDSWPHLSPTVPHSLWCSCGCWSSIKWLSMRLYSSSLKISHTNIFLFFFYFRFNDM